MARMFQSVDLFLLFCLVFGTESEKGQIPAPQNVTLLWVHDFEPQLSWTPPQDLPDGCTYEVNSSTSTNDFKDPFWKEYTVMEGGSLNLSVRTLCNNSYSEPVYIKVADPELVRNLMCYIRSPKETHCSWLQASPAKDLGFFYDLVTEDGTTDAENDSAGPLRECPLYNNTDGVRTGCTLQATLKQDIHILFNGTLNDKLVRNTFKKELLVRPPPLQWEVNKTVDKFNISWSPPKIGDPSHWMYRINYTQCKESKQKDVYGESSIELNLVSHCQHCIAIKAIWRSKTEEETPWSDTKCFGADTDPNAMVYAAIIIPLMVAGLAFMVFMCYRKNKENIFPKIPEPRDLLSDISDNNNKATVCNFYTPAEEENSCEITLVKDPQKQNLYS